MRVLTPIPQKRPSSRQVSAAAENIAAAQFAMHGLDVLEQGRRARYFYDLSVANSAGMMKVTVYGSFRGFWNLLETPAGSTTEALKPAECHRAINRWFDRQGRHVVFCLVQFEPSDLKSMPRMYLATPAEIAARLHTSVEQLGDVALYEQYEIEDSTGLHTVETLPADWRFSEQRIAELMTTEDKPSQDFKLAANAAFTAPAAQSTVLQSLPMVN